MERRHIRRLLVCVCVGCFGVLATAFSVVSEITHVRADQVFVVGEDDCLYPRSSAWVMGLLAASFLLLSQLIANACGGCSICCCNTNNRDLLFPSRTRAMAILCLVLSWITFGNAIFLLLEGVAVNGRQQNFIGQEGIHGPCYILKAGVYGVAGALCMFTCGLSIMYYWMSTGKNMGHGTAHAPPPLVAHMAPIFCFSSNASPPIAYVAGFELPKRYHPTYLDIEMR